MKTDDPDLRFPMPPVSTAHIEVIGNFYTEHFFPEMHEKPTPVNIRRIIQNNILSINGFDAYDIYPVAHEEIPNKHAVTEPTTTNRHTIKMRYDLYDDLLLDWPKSNFAISTLLHELGHAFLRHDFRMGRLLQLFKKPDLLALARRNTRKLKPYEDPEWQAFCMAGCIAMPRKSILLLNNPTVERVAKTFRVSCGFASRHLKRLKIQLPEA